VSLSSGTPSTTFDLEPRRVISRDPIRREQNLRVHEYDKGKTQVAGIQHFGSGGAGADAEEV
jgi:hypothetical protein